MLYHFTTPEGARRILAEGVIRANGKDRVYLTQENLTLEAAHNILFIGSPLYRDRTVKLGVEVDEQGLDMLEDGKTGYECVARGPVRRNKGGFGDFSLVA